jgi:hypothetical protein
MQQAETSQGGSLRLSRKFCVGLSLTLLFAVTATASWAHHGPHPPVLVAGSVADPISGPGGSPALPLLVALAAAGALGASRRRHLALSVVILLLVLEFETGLHAVHHLGEPARAAECATAAATAHLIGSLVDGGVTAEPVDILALHPVGLDFPTPVAQRPPAPYVGRSPPTSIA